MPVYHAKEPQKRGLYIHSNNTVSKASSATKSGRVNTLTTRRTEDSVETSQDVDIALEVEHSGLEELSFDFELISVEADAEAISGISMKAPAKRYLNSDKPLLTWINYRDSYLDALLEFEGRGCYSSKCIACGEEDPRYRCADCHGHEMYCKKCLIKYHEDKPLHIIMELCILHTNGIHKILAAFCGCTSRHHYEQMMELAWFPATPLNPQTGATYAVLRQFHTLNLQGKTTAFDFYKSLVLLTDVNNLEIPPDWLEAFMLMVREWRHLKMAKRAGRGHDTGGIQGTPSGGLAIQCRACPHPNINLPVGWESSPEKVWLYELILSQDANFRLKNRLRSSDEKDPSLGPGWAYFVGSDEYLRHISQYVDQDEVNIIPINLFCGSSLQAAP
ncbi:hypothetical protein H0H92_008575 [Tricholoma furcatifolium]|nr:hypothetical protein H0H92_008575 [Tricholoma furcatifolium]